MNAAERLPLSLRLLAACGALLAAGAVGLSAYASHGVEADDRMRLFLAATIAFGHGVALATLAPQATGRWAVGALVLMLVGVLGFSGSLVAAHFFGVSTRLAPVGGSLMMFAWLLHAVARLRH